MSLFPSGRVIPTTFPTPLSWEIRSAIWSRSAKARGLRRSEGAWTKRYWGIIELAGKCALSVRMP
ncbi:Uncharacterised protein [Mycobacteroides abscessus subsp. abscessus]|nr:Uncharacterised protein [Mycobacteroides abscessus subsp. abscessus]